MKVNVYSILDAKVGLYSRPFQCRTDGEALRPFMNTVDDQNSELHKWPEDYTLCRLGTFTEETGIFENEQTPVHIAKAIDYHKKNQKPALHRAD